MMRVKITKYSGFGLLFAFILISNGLGFIPGLGLWDEASVFVVLVYTLVKNNGKFLFEKDVKLDFLTILAITSLGFLGNIYHIGIQESNVAIYKDVVAFLKFPVLFTLLRQNERYIFCNERKRSSIRRLAANISKLFVILCFAGLFLGVVFNIGFYENDPRIFSQSYVFIFSDPTFLVSSLVMAIAALIAEGRKKNAGFIILGCVAMFVAQRFKGYAAIMFAILFVVVADSFVKKIIKINRKSKLRKEFVIPICLVVSIPLFFIFKDRFSTYLTWGMESARIALYVVGVKIVIDMFPIGSGFGTFGSWLSAEYYSNLYYQYRLDDVYGLRPNQYNYASDTQWPWIFAQFGIFGMILYARLIYRYIKNQLNHLNNIDHILAFAYMWIYILLAGCMEAYLTNSSGVASAFILSIYIGTDKELNENHIFQK